MMLEVWQELLRQHDCHPDLVRSRGQIWDRKLRGVFSDIKIVSRCRMTGRKRTRGPRAAIAFMNIHSFQTIGSLHVTNTRNFTKIYCCVQKVKLAVSVPNKNKYNNKQYKLLNYKIEKEKLLGVTSKSHWWLWSFIHMKQVVWNRSEWFDLVFSKIDREREMGYVYC